MKTPILLNNWAVASRPANPYQAPELWAPCLVGDPIDHPRLGSPTEGITTSTIVGRRGDNVVTRSGSVYALGTVDPAYEKEYPDARARLMASLKEIES